ncbi:MAG: flagellar motor protein [Polyangiaceae bacterium]|jgi:chemotaxis protein MotA|nr:flagellar motor protein [Polyangiaceae bacterium]
MGPLLGIFVALGTILLGNLLEGGHISSIIGGPAALIVLGGTIGATMVQFPLDTVKEAVGAVGGLFKKNGGDPQKLVDEIVEYANRARREGILGLEKLAPTASDPFLSKALMMAIDGADSNAIRETMEITIMQEEEHGENLAKVYETAGGYSPTIGIIGAVLGLIHVMSNLSDINAVGTGIAAAFVATIYGVAVANILFLPIGGRMKLALKERVNQKNMMLTGVLAIQEGVNPKLVRDRLSEFVPSHGGKKGAASGAAAPAAT